MLRLAVLAAVGVLSAAGAARALMAQTGPAPAGVQALRGPEASDASPQAAETAAAGMPAEVAKGPDGHYWAEADVDGTQVHLLVDTGASAVALTATDAQRLGFDPQSLTYDVPVHTANGETEAARVRLASLSVGGARVEDVEAMVVRQGLSQSLLGMSYLGRLQSFQATPRALILTP